MRVKVILNPTSDKGRAVQYADKIVEWARPFGGVDLVQTNAPGHGRTLAREAAEQGYDLVVAAGGDGTVHEVVNGLVHGSHAAVPLGVIPIGSGNDFAFAHGIAMDVQTAVSQLFTGTLQPTDLARVEDEHGRYRILHNNFGVGFDAIVLIRTHSITRIHGFAMYLLAVLQTIAFYYQTPKVTLHFDGERIDQAILFLTAGIGPRHGGGFMLTPDANVQDGLIDSCTVNPIGRLTMLRMLVQAIKGTHIHSRHVTMRKNKEILIRGNTPLPIHIDGELFAHFNDNVKEVSITTLPSAIQVMVPGAKSEG